MIAPRTVASSRRVRLKAAGIAQILSESESVRFKPQRVHVLQLLSGVLRSVKVRKLFFFLVPSSYCVSQMPELEVDLLNGELDGSSPKIILSVR